MRMQVSLKDAFYLVTLMALLSAWLVDRRALNNEAATLLAELYKHNSRMRHMLQDYRFQPPGYSSLAPGMEAQYQGTGVTLDSATISGRRDALIRLKKGDLDFLILDRQGQKVRTVQGGPGWDHRTLADLDGR